MTGARTYLDWNATAPLRRAARAAMIAALDEIGNPSSVHAEGRRARRLVEDAREAVAALVGAKPSLVVFTSGATEANTMVMAAGWDTILTFGIEHPSVLVPASVHARRIEVLPADADGTARVEQVAHFVQSEHRPLGRALVSLQLANNETGVLQPVTELAAVARERGMAVHSDATQAVGRVTCDVEASGLDYLTLSSHKIGGPKGAGALVLRDGAPMAPLIRGGGQERGHRAGTENVAAIAGFGAAASEALGELAQMPAVARRRDALEAAVLDVTPEAIVIGREARRLPNTSTIAMPGRRAETLVAALDLAGIAISAGAACSSGKVGPSGVLAAMGLAPEIVRGAVRISIGASTTDKDIAAFLAAWTTVAGAAARAA